MIALARLNLANLATAVRALGVKASPLRTGNGEARERSGDGERSGYCVISGGGMLESTVSIGASTA